jgi:hypothetical protein
MKSEQLQIAFCLISLTVSSVVAQIDATLKAYFPMNIGNVWEYKVDLIPPEPSKLEQPAIH